MRTKTKTEIRSARAGYESGQGPPWHSGYTLNVGGLLTTAELYTMKKYEEAPPGYKWIFRPYIKTKDGKIIYPKNARFFKFLVPIK